MTKPYSVLHTYQDFYPKRGGIEDHILNLCQASYANTNPTVLTSQAKQYTSRDIVYNIPVIRLASWGRYYTPFCPTMPYYLRQYPNHILHLHLPCPMAVFAYLMTRPNNPLIIGYHNDIVRPQWLLRLYRPFLNHVLQRANYILVSSLAYLNSSTILQPFRHKCVIIPYGLELAQFEPTPAQMAQAKAIKASYAKPLILFVGRLCYYKGLEYLIPVMHQVPAMLLIVGSGPLANKLKRLVLRHDLTHKVKFIGLINELDLMAYYRACEMVVLPSTYRSEAFGLVQLKAQACCRPVISTDLPGVSSVNLHQQTGLVIQSRSTSALSASINELLSNPTRRLQMGELGRKRIEDYYQAHFMVRRIQEVYRNVCQ